MDRWAALLRFDEEISAAADLLRPYGDKWVEELDRAYFALDQNKQRLPSIVRKLVEEAEKEKADLWAKSFRQLGDGELCTEASLDILRKAEIHGYILEAQYGAIAVSKVGSGTSYLRSNYDIQQFAKHRRLG